MREVNFREGDASIYRVLNASLVFSMLQNKRQRMQYMMRVGKWASMYKVNGHVGLTQHEQYTGRLLVFAAMGTAWQALSLTPKIRCPTF